MLLSVITGCVALAQSPPGELFVDAESFDELGGWKLDTQFNESVGSPYLLAHGLGRPVADARTTVALEKRVVHRVWVRTFDWVERWEPDLPASQSPGRFQVLADGVALENVLGVDGSDWGWHLAGEFAPEGDTTEITLRDLTGFDGRVDALLFTSTGLTPPDDDVAIEHLRRRSLGDRRRVDFVAPRPDEPFDLVVVGGGYAGTAAALSAARMGADVALIQDRFVLGGNGSSEVRVWAKGHIRRGRFPRVGEIVEEFSDHATLSPGPADEFGDARKEDIVRAEPRITLFLGTRVDGVTMKDGAIESVDAFDVRTGQRLNFRGRFVCDATGHGEVGALAGADHDMTRKGHLGMSNMWMFADVEEPAPFPEVPWALELELDDFPIPHGGRGEWFWESGFDKAPIEEAESIRDWNLRAVFGAFDALKRGPLAEKYTKAELQWIAYVAGPRESRRLMGDVLLTRDHIVEKTDFPDGCVATTWTIDLHYPKPAYDSHPDNPFIAYADHDRRIDRNYGYPVPYRCLYSRNVPNLFMAGRNISVTHEALGTVRVMKTGGMMGEVVGKAAALAVQHDTTPRGVYATHLAELFELLELPGRARRDEIGGETHVPEDALALAGPLGPFTGVDPATIDGVVVDDANAEKIGDWSHGTGLAGHVAYGYVWANPDSGARIRFSLRAPESGSFDVALAYRPHENRGGSVPVRVEVPSGDGALRAVDMRAGPGEGEFAEFATVSLTKGDVVVVEIGTEGAGGLATADAVRLTPAR